MDIILTDAKLIKIDKDLDLEWNQKFKGEHRAHKDFWKIGIA